MMKTMRMREYDDDDYDDDDDDDDDGNCIQACLILRSSPTHLGHRTKDSQIQPNPPMQVIYRTKIASPIHPGHIYI